MGDLDRSAIRREERHLLPLGDAPDGTAAIAVVERAGSFHVRRSRRPSNSTLALVTAGRGWFSCGGEEIALRPGMAYASSLGSRMEMRCDPHDPMSVRLLMVRGEAFPSLLQRELGSRDGAWRLNNAGECLRLFDLLLDEARGARPHSGRIASSLVQALVLTVRRGLEQVPAPAGGLDLYLRARSMLESQAVSAAPPPLAAVAARLRITTVHLHRVFRRHTGLPPSTWLRHRRLDIAAARLRSGAPVSAIAGELGWSDPYAFSRAFRRRFGMPPSSWRGVE